MLNSTTFANRLAAHIGRDLSAAHRGVLTYPKGRLVVFGNDGYRQDRRSRRQVLRLRHKLRLLSYTEEAFGLDPTDGYTWALVVKPPRPFDRSAAGQALHQHCSAEEVTDLVWECWGAACRPANPALRDCFIHYHRQVARAVTSSFQCQVLPSVAASRRPALACVNE